AGNQQREEVPPSVNRLRDEMPVGKIRVLTRQRRPRKDEDAGGRGRDHARRNRERDRAHCEWKRTENGGRILVRFYRNPGVRQSERGLARRADEECRENGRTARPEPRKAMVTKRESTKRREQSSILCALCSHASRLEDIPPQILVVDDRL